MKRSSVMGFGDTASQNTENEIWMEVYCFERGRSLYYLTFPSVQAMSWSSINNEINVILTGSYSFQKTFGTFSMKSFSTTAMD